jgi:hypothetical protein
MDNKSRINAILHREKPDKIPFAPYDNLVPRGEFERMLRNRGMGLLTRVNSIWEETPHIPVEIKNDDDGVVKIYHTPTGDLTTRIRTHVGRLKGDDLDLDSEGLIKGVDDYEAAISLIDDTVFHLDESAYWGGIRDLGNDGILKDNGLFTPYGSTRYLYGASTGFVKWVQDQSDYPDRFEELMRAVLNREERRLYAIEQSPVEFVGLGDLDGTWGPAKMRKYDLPLYQKWIPRLKAKGKVTSIHAHALNMSRFTDYIRETGCDVVEAFTPPPIGDLSLADARAAWGEDTVIWLNFPETIFLSGRESVKQYTLDLIKSDPYNHALVLSFTEMGLWGAMNDEQDRLFKEGTMAIVDAIEEFCHLD